MLRSLLLAAVAGGLLASAAAAGEQYVDATGFAVSGYDVVSYFDLTQAPVGQPQPVPAAGRTDITAEWNGATFAFASEANRDRFLADPAAYAPQFDGHCAYGVAKGGKVPGNPTLWRIVDGRLYLNITRPVAGFWEQDIPGNIALAEDNWTGGVEAAPAATSPVPEFTPQAPVGN
jgi:YHS domain-containing protein